MTREAHSHSPASASPEALDTGLAHFHSEPNTAGGVQVYAYVPDDAPSPGAPPYFYPHQRTPLDLLPPQPPYLRHLDEEEWSILSYLYSLTEYLSSQP